jgi:predicted PurR-regulated permease PerM
MEHEQTETAHHPDTWVNRTFRTATTVAGVAAVFLIAWYAIDLLLLVFAGILLAVMLGGLANLLRRFLPLGYRAALAVTLILLVALVSISIWQFSTRLIDEADALVQELPRAAGNIMDRLERYDWFRRLAGEASEPQRMISNGPQMLVKVTGFLSSTFGAITALFVILLLGVYIAFDPDRYRNGLLRLVPPARRFRASQVLDRLGHTLRLWLVAYFAAMVVVGLLTGIGLALLGVPLAFVLAVIAAVMAFIPNIGPVLSAIPAILIALSLSPRTALYVALLYIAVQTVESNFIQPVFQMKAISMPPALTISMQLLLGSLVGIFGLLMASPVCASAMVLVQMLYIEDKLGERITGP